MGLPEQDGYYLLAQGYQRADLPLQERAQLLQQGWRQLSRPSTQERLDAARTGAAAGLALGGTLGLVGAAGSGVVSRTLSGYRDGVSERTAQHIYDFVHSAGPDGVNARTKALQDLLPGYHKDINFVAAGLGDLDPHLRARAAQQTTTFDVSDAKRFVRQAEHAWGRDKPVEMIAALKQRARQPDAGMWLRATPVPTTANPNPLPLGHDLAHRLNSEFQRGQSVGTRALYALDDARRAVQARAMRSVAPSLRKRPLLGLATSPLVLGLGALAAGGAYGGVQQRNAAARTYSEQAEWDAAETARYLSSHDERLRHTRAMEEARKLREDDKVPAFLQADKQAPLRDIAAAAGKEHYYPDTIGRVLETADFLRGVGE